MMCSGRFLALVIVFLSLTGSARALTGESHLSLIGKATDKDDTRLGESSQMLRDINKILKIVARKAIEINKN